jgi:hypothetical protein
MVILPWDNDGYHYTNQFRHCSAKEMHELFRQHPVLFQNGNKYFVKESTTGMYPCFEIRKKSKKLSYIDGLSYSQNLFIIMKTTCESPIKEIS